MPSVASLDEGFYYAHKRNCFWAMMSEILGEPLPGSVDAKKDLLYRYKIALWDVAQSCEREGSLDSNILSPLPNDIAGLLDACHGITSILFNGGTAFRLCKKLCPEVFVKCRSLQLPSTSPAYTLPYDKKLAAWQDAIQ